MNERGFFTFVGLCFLIVAAILVKGVQESEGNYYSSADDFLTAAELQNIAESALIEAVDLIKNKEIELKESKATFYTRSENQHEIYLNNSYDADVKIFYEYGKYENGGIGNIWFMTRKYSSGGYDDGDFLKDASGNYIQRTGVIIISVASRESEKVDGKIYRRAIAYFFTDDEDEKIYFMNSLDKEK